MEIQGSNVYATKVTVQNQRKDTEKTEAERLAEAAKRTEAAKTAVTEKPAEPPKKAEDAFVKTDDSAQITYKPPKKLTAEQANSINEQRAMAYQQMLTSMLGNQAQTYNAAKGLTPSYLSGTKDTAKAAAAIAPGGEYSVDAVATRILDMAKSLAGGDKSKISMLRDAVKKGFKAAGAELGGKLPSISNDTYTEVMKRFDEWENKSDAARV